MGEIVNLRRARKRRARGKAELEAAANRVASGVPASERKIADALRAIDRDRLDAHRRAERGDDE